MFFWHSRQETARPAHMQTLMGQAESTLGSLLNMYYNGDGTDGEEAMEAKVVRAHQELTHAVRTNGDCAAPLNTLLEFKCPVSIKYAKLEVKSLLQDNCQSLEQLKTLPVALGMLEKYGRHLLKPPNARVQQWRHINFNNPIFKDRVLPMQQMGYSEAAQGGLRFATDEPDPEATAKLVADILLARTEIERYLTGKHLHPETIHALLPEDAVNQVVHHWENAQGTETATTSAPPTSLASYHLGRPPTPVSVPVEGETERGDPVQTAEMLPMAESTGETDLSMSAVQVDDSLLKACDICGETAASLWCRLCDNKQLCGVCDDMWHKHPKRQNHQREPIASLPSPSSTPPQDPIMGPFGIRALHSMSSQSRDGESSPTPVSSRQSSGSDHHSRTPPPVPSRTPPPQQIEAQPPPGPHPSSHPYLAQHAVIPQQAGGSQALLQESAAINPSTSIQMHQQQLLLYQQQQQRLFQQQQQQQQQRLLQQQQQGGFGDYYGSTFAQGTLGAVAASQPQMVSESVATLPSVLSQNATYPNVSAQNSVYPKGLGAENWMYGGVPAEKSTLPPFPVLEPEPVQPAVSVSHHRMSQVGLPDVSMRTAVASVMPPGASGGGYTDMSLRQPAQVESVKGVVPPGTVQGNVFDNRLERRHSAHLPHTTPSLSTRATSTESSLLKSVLAESDYEKRAAKCDVRLLTLEEDLKEVESQLTDLMLTAEDVTECDDFRTLNRRKARLVKEHKALSDYRQELADLMSAESAHPSNTIGGPHPVSQIFHPPPLVSASPLSSFPSAQSSPALPVSTSPTQQQLGFSYPHQASQSPVHPQEPVPISVYRPPLPQSTSFSSPAMQESSSHNALANSNSSIDRSSILSQWQMGPTVSSSSSPAVHHSHHTAYPPPRYQQGDYSNSCAALGGDQPKQQQLSDPPFRGQGGATLPVAQELISFASPVPPADSHSTKDTIQHTQQSMNTPSSEPLYCLAGQPLDTIQIGFENIVAEELNSSHPLTGQTVSTPPTQPASAAQSQQTHHAGNSHIPSGPANSRLEVPAQRWECSHCTYINEPGTRVCIICDRTTDNPTLLPTREAPQAVPSAQPLLAEPLVETTPSVETAGGAGGVEMALVNMEQLANFQRRIVEEQDQVYFEKKEAQKQFYRSTPLPTTAPSPLPQGSSPSSISAAPPPLPPRDHIPPVLPPRTPPPTSKPRASEGELQQQAERRQDREPGQKPPPPSQPPSAFTLTEGVGGGESGESSSAGGLDSAFLQEGDFSMTMERFSEQKQIKQLQLDGADLMHIIKMGDRAGFSVEELEVALQNCKGGMLELLQWLQSSWIKLVQVVQASTRAEGQRLEHNDVGELSAQEARIALCHTKGDMMAAVRSCVAKRKQLYQSLNPKGSFAREEVLQAMLQCCGDEERARQQLQASVLQPFVERVWASGEREREVTSSTLLQMTMSERNCQSVSTSVISHANFQQAVMDQSVDRDRRIRMILIEGKLKSWGRAEMVIKLLDVDLPLTYPPPQPPPTGDGEGESPPYTLEDVVEAVRNCRDRQSARVYLTQECSTCLANYPMSKIRNLNFCQCKMCKDCLKQNFEVVIREKHVRHWTCPICGHPDLNNPETATEYLGFLAMLLQTQVDREVYELFETKVRDWHLQKDPNFRWCAHCGNGFIADENQLCMQCPHCDKKTCYSCKKQWEDQHEGLTCAQFEQWKIDNDPNNQAVGLARHLEENGIDCPSCKMRYALAKGGCMHFKCPQCGHEFCSGCCQPFYQTCPSRHCKVTGLHAHHPRDCFFYLRDEDVQHLQSLLRESNVVFNTEPPEGQEDVWHCPVIEQKEFDSGKADESCGKDTLQGHAGLCVVHYKEYLVGLINKNHIDPVSIMTVEALKILLKRSDIGCPRPGNNESEANFRKRLIKFVKDKVPLPSRGP